MAGKSRKVILRKYRVNFNDRKPFCRRSRGPSLNFPTLPDNNEYIPSYSGPINNKRLSSHHQIDFRIDKYWILNDFIISTYIDFRNILQSKHVTSIEYNEDYTAQEEEVSVDSEVPLIFLGMKIDF